MMKLELDVYSAICETKIFSINGVGAKLQDFGEKFDAEPDKKRFHVCGNMIFNPKNPTQKVLDKYGINVSEYTHICDQLRRYVSFGTCRLCG